RGAEDQQRLRGAYDRTVADRPPGQHEAGDQQKRGELQGNVHGAVPRRADIARPGAVPHPAADIAEIADVVARPAETRIVPRPPHDEIGDQKQRRRDDPAERAEPGGGGSNHAKTRSLTVRAWPYA